MKYEQVEINGHQIAYRRMGSGQPVLLLHGVASHSFLWDEIIHGLADEYDVIAPDLLGCGASDKPEGVDYSITSQANIFMAFIDKLELKDVHLVGHDVGGGVVQLMTVRRPGQLTDLTMINPVGYDYWPVQPITTMRLPVIRGLTSSVMNKNMLRMVIRRAIYHKDRLTNNVMDIFWQPFETVVGKKGFVQLISCINNRLLMDEVENLRKIDLPTLVIRGEADAYLGKEITERLATDIPGARLIKVPKGGHFIQLDEPEKIVELLRDFFVARRG